MQLPQTWGGGTDSYKRGTLKRRLDSIILARLDPSITGNVGSTSKQLVLKNINGDLNIHLVASFSGPTDGTPILPGVVAAGAATIQLTPAQLTPNSGRIYLRPVFQDPAAAANQNHPLPQDLPFGWEFSTEADEVYIDVEIANSLFNGTNLDGQIVVSATIEYNGSWWSPEAIKFALSQVQLTNVRTDIIGTAAT